MTYLDVRSPEEKAHSDLLSMFVQQQVLTVKVATALSQLINGNQEAAKQTLTDIGALAEQAQEALKAFAHASGLLGDG